MTTETKLTMTLTEDDRETLYEALNYMEENYAAGDEGDLEDRLEAAHSALRAAHA